MKENVLLENYKGFDVFFDKNKDELFFTHEVIGRVSGFRISSIEENIDSLFDSTFIPTTRGYDIRGDGYIDVLGFNAKGNFIVEYEGGFKSNMVSTAGDDYFLEESRGIVKEIRDKEMQILGLKGEIKKLRDKVVTIKSLIK